MIVRLINPPYESPERFQTKMLLGCVCTDLPLHWREGDTSRRRSWLHGNKSGDRKCLRDATGAPREHANRLRPPEMPID